MKKMFFLIAFALLTINALTTFTLAEFLIEDSRTGKLVPAIDHPDYFTMGDIKGVTFVFLNGTAKVMDENEVWLDCNGRLYLDGWIFDLLDPRKIRITEGYVFSRSKTGMLLVTACLKDGKRAYYFIHNRKFVYSCAG